MPTMYNKTRPYQSRGRSVHWEDEFVPPSDNENSYKPPYSTNVKKCGQRICVNTSLPYHSKLNIRVHVNRVNRDDSNENNQVNATARIQRLEPQNDYKHFEELEKLYCQHYLIESPNESMIKNADPNTPRRYEITPKHRQISVPVSLPVDHRLFLYIQNGEIYARC